MFLRPARGKGVNLGDLRTIPLKTNSGCYVHTQLFLALYMCVFILNGFPLWLFVELDSLLWNIALEVSGPFYSLITKNYATNFNMNFQVVSLLL